MQFRQITWGWGTIIQLLLVPDMLKQIKPYEAVKSFNILHTFSQPSLQKYRVKAKEQQYHFNHVFFFFFLISGADGLDPSLFVCLIVC